MTSDSVANGFANVGAAKMQGLNWPQVRTIIISQAIRNAMEALHGTFSDTKEGFLTDSEMMRLNILIRKTTHEVVKRIVHMERDYKAMRKGKEPFYTEDVNWCLFQCATYHPEYMEAPGSAALAKAFKKYVTDYKGEDKK